MELYKLITNAGLSERECYWGSKGVWYTVTGNPYGLPGTVYKLRRGGVEVINKLNGFDSVYVPLYSNESVEDLTSHITQPQGTAKLKFGEVEVFYGRKFVLGKLEGK